MMRQHFVLRRSAFALFAPSCAAVAVCAVLGAVRADAQGPTASQAQAWVSYFGENRIAPNWRLYTEASLRRADAGATWQQQLWAVGATRELSPRWRVTAALGGARSYPYGELPARAHSIEVRPWVQVQGTHPAGRITWTDRTRIERRAVRPYGRLAPSEPPWQTSYRLRRLDRFVMPFGARRVWYGAALQEWFTNVAPANRRSPVLEQARTQLLLGRDVRAGVRVEGGYMLQVLARPQGVREYNHTMLLVVRNVAPWR
jgi:hypothetical protein